MNSAFSLLEEVQKQKYKKYVFKKFSQLQIGDYPVTKFRFIKSNYGLKRRLAVLMDGTPSADEITVICLPDRFTAALSTQEQVDDLNNKRYIMSYNGMDSSQHNRIDVLLHEVVEDGVVGMDTIDY